MAELAVTFLWPFAEGILLAIVSVLTLLSCLIFLVFQVRLLRRLNEFARLMAAPQQMELFAGFALMALPRNRGHRAGVGRENDTVNCAFFG